MLEHVNDVEMRIVVAKVLAAAANAVLVAQHHFQLGTHLTTALARLQVYNLAGSTRKKKGAEEGKCKKLRVAVWPGNKEMQVVLACFPNEKVKLFLRPLEL